MDRAYIIQKSIRLKIAWKLLVFAYFGLSMASWGILSNGADLSAANGRHLLAGALANFSLVIMGIMIAVTAFQKGERWAWYANLMLLLYGIPMIILDSYYAGFWTMAVIPQFFGMSVFLVALLLPVDIFIKRH